MKIVSIVFISLLAVIGFTTSHCTAQKELAGKGVATDTIRIGSVEGPYEFEIEFGRGRYHNHPSFAIWMEDLSGSYLQTLFVTRSVGTGVYGHGAVGTERWDSKPGPQSRPASLPYWLHKRSEALKVPLLPSPENPLTDGNTGATPSGGFVVMSGVPTELPQVFKVMFEINQPWDWNEYWTNSLFDDPDYRTSCQPSVVYAGTVDRSRPDEVVFLNPVGHGHHSGKDGRLYTDLRTLTTALGITDHISVKLIKK